MTKNYIDKYIKYNNKYLLLKKIIINVGGRRDFSFASQIINNLVKTYNQTKQQKIEINNKKHPAGIVFIGSRPEDEHILRILVGVQMRWNSTIRKLEKIIDTFGGNNEGNETVLETAVRESIEEIFNIKPKHEVLKEICDYLNGKLNGKVDDTIFDYYYVFCPKKCTKEYYTYIFDVSILGNFVDTLIKYDQKIITIGKKSIELIKYIEQIKTSGGISSYGTIGTEFKATGGKSIKLKEFMKDRFVYTSIPSHGLNEVCYLDFPEFNDFFIKMLENVNLGHEYKIHNENLRIGPEILQTRNFFAELLVENMPFHKIKDQL